VILLVHGMARDSTTWRFVLPALAERFTVIAPDLVGHGESEKPRGDYSLGAFASGVRDLLLALGHERATVVGHSFGGGVAMQFAYQFPEHCERLVLVSSGGLGDDVNLLLRLLTLPGAELVLPLACNTWVRDAGNNVSRWLDHIGLRTSPHITEIWDSYGSLADGKTRVIGYTKPVGRGGVTYYALGHCHNPAIRAARPTDPSDWTPATFRAPWQTDAFTTLLRNAILWATAA